MESPAFGKELLANHGFTHCAVADSIWKNPPNKDPQVALNS
jgi:hypothetical protein